MTLLNPRRGALSIAVAMVATVGAAAIPANVHAHGHDDSWPDAPVGFVYGTFDQEPNLTLLVGGTVEEFCRNKPDDPFNAQPGSSPTRVKERRDGSTVIRIRDHAEPVHLYEVDNPNAPEWIAGVCANLFDGDPATVVPAPFASGSAKLRARIHIDGGTVDVFNAARGRVVAADGTVYRVKASADLVVEDGVPQGDPADFVKLDVRRLRCR